MQLGPVVHISDDGQSAQIRVRLFVMFGQDGRAAQWGEGIYENTFVKDNGVWKYNNLHGYQTFYTNYEDGWAKKSSAMFSPFPDIHLTRRSRWRMTRIPRCSRHRSTTGIR